MLVIIKNISVPWKPNRQNSAVKMHFLKNVPSTTSTSSAFYYDRAPDTTARWVVFKRYLLNLEEKTACNRSATSWCSPNKNPLFLFHITLFQFYC
ncbi:hypothetical protein Zmor_016002 [Zophobas morio]|uniref:Uncharacterized protein n=1 Tax=Zophobas morio TaxID=2755281 RepID=A0AA38IJ22_9CUCU|nr:hypothetical protein Zmor_016002 [Zophobas morio]